MIIKNEKLTFDELLDRVDYSFYMAGSDGNQIVFKEDVDIQNCEIIDIPCPIIFTSREKDNIKFIFNNNLIKYKEYKEVIFEHPDRIDDKIKQGKYNKENISLKK